jgi:hypothetical protein
MVGQIDIDFYILETGNPRTISIFDNSNWLYSENLPAYLEIKVPGSKKVRTYSFIKNAINTLNSHNLGLSCLSADCTDEEYVDLPDGIYCITLKSGYEGIEETKYYLKTDQFELKLAEKVKNSTEDDIEVDKLYKIYWYLQKAKAETKLGYWKEADRYFTEAQKQLEKTDCRDGTNSNCK